MRDGSATSFRHHRLARGRKRSTFGSSGSGGDRGQPRSKIDETNVGDMGATVQDLLDLSLIHI